MSDNIKSIEGVIAKNAFYDAENSEAVTPLQTLKAVIQDIEDGTLEVDGLVICVYKKDCQPDWYAANLGIIEATGLLESTKISISLDAFND